MHTEQGQRETIPPALPEPPGWLCLMILAILVVGVLARPLFFDPGEVLSDPHMDLAHYFIHWRFFGFEELKAGRLALWNPHCCCGMPFFGNFQSALLYPLNAVFLVLPLAAAINWTIAANIFLGGVFTYFWTRNRGLHSIPCTMAGAMFMFCGAHFLQIVAGHLPNLCTLIWAPLLFLSIDLAFDKPGLQPCLLGMFTLAMAVFAGHPQYVFYLGVAAGIYSLLNLIKASRRGAVMVNLAVIVAGGLALCAVQLLTGMDEGRESMRSMGVSYEFASSFSFPPENLLTLVSPWCFGKATHLNYFGRWFISDDSAFVGVMGLLLAIHGMFAGSGRTRRFATMMVVASLVLALGGYTPFFHFLYAHVPGFDRFRGMDKFIWISSLFLCLLAAIGLDGLLRGSRPAWWLMGGAGILGIALVLTANGVAGSTWWTKLIKLFATSDANVYSQPFYSDPKFIFYTASVFRRAALIGAACLFMAATILVVARFRLKCGLIAILSMVVIELVWFASSSVETFRPPPCYPPDIANGLALNPGDYRIKAENPNSAMTAGTFDLGGDDPTSSMRYVRYLNISGGYDMGWKPGDRPDKRFNIAAWRMLRCRYVISESRDTCDELSGGLPRLLLLDQCRVMTNGFEICQTLTNAAYPVNRQVILEEKPDPYPRTGGALGTVNLIKSTTDAMTIEADVPASRILLVTDTFSRGWRIHSLPGSSQSEYRIMPANYCLRAVPLSAGHHLFQMEYAPLGFRIGKIVSLVAWTVFAGLIGLSIDFKNLRWRR